MQLKPTDPSSLTNLITCLSANPECPKIRDRPIFRADTDTDFLSSALADSRYADTDFQFTS